MSTIPGSALHRTRTFIENHRIALRTLVLVAAVATMGDAFVFERSMTHALVGHSLVVMGLLVALIFIESPEEQWEATKSPASPERQPADTAFGPLQR